MSYWFCSDCGKGEHTGYFGYMVHHNLWRATVPKHWWMRHICLPCFRKRLGREMSIDDFLACGLNQGNMLEILKFLGGKKNIRTA
jgi:hypothetical protein